jgi:hypothetical protein
LMEAFIVQTDAAHMLLATCLCCLCVACMSLVALLEHCNIVVVV